MNKIKALCSLLTIFSCCVMLSNCASIVKGSNQTVPVSSNPNGANYKVYDETGNIVKRGKTPDQVQLQRGKGYFSNHQYRVVLNKPGYQEETAMLMPNLSPWYVVGNYFFSGPIGWLLVDPSTGAMWDYSPDQLNVNMGK